MHSAYKKQLLKLTYVNKEKKTYQIHSNLNEPTTDQSSQILCSFIRTTPAFLARHSKSKWLGQTSDSDEEEKSLVFMNQSLSGKA